MDERTIHEFGIDGFTLMEIAGTRAADLIQTEIEENTHGLFFCGKGNNAGDALVVARLLSQNNYQVTVCFVSGTENLAPDTQKNFDLLQKTEGDISFVEWGDFISGSYDFIVDGMLGTGLKNDLRDPYYEAVSWINEQNVPVFSLDVPTGLDADSGDILGAAVEADFTLAFGALKTGFFLNEGKKIAGEIILCDLPFPNKFRKADAFLIDREWIGESASVLKKRKHKYDGGVLYIIAGSEGLTGAAILSAKSAWAAGVGAVILITPKGLLEVYEKNLIQIIKKPIGRSENKFFRNEHLEEVQTVLQEKPGKLLIGPGLGRTSETMEFTQNLLKNFEGDIIIDADALFALAQLKHWEKPQHSNWILTPHAGELKKLIQQEADDDHSRMNLVREVSSGKNIYLLSKGYPVILGTDKDEIYLTGYDTEIFSRAGFGDILAGKIGAFWVGGMSAEEAIIHALLDGHEKSQQILANSDTPEPLNII